MSAMTDRQAISIYDNAKHWVMQYESVDEVKDYADKAAACEEYARRANDTEMENKAAMARLRAERRCGQLLVEMEKAKGTNGQLHGRDSSGPRMVRGPEDKPKTLSDMGLTYDKSSTYQRLANVPEEQFEELAVNTGDYRPTARNIVSMATTKPEPKSQRKVDGMELFALDAFGRFEDFNKHHFHQDLAELVEHMTKPMKRDMQEFIPKFKQWLEDYYVSIESD